MAPDQRHQPTILARLPFTVADLAEVRWSATSAARRAGLDPDRAESFMLAVNEAVTNALRYGRGRRELEITRDPGGGVVATISDGGPGFPVPARPIRPPEAGQSGGRGLWLMRRLCDRMDVTSGPSGNTVRLEMITTLAGR